jgi:hypothetical protein
LGTLIATLNMNNGKSVVTLKANCNTICQL